MKITKKRLEELNACSSAQDFLKKDISIKSFQEYFNIVKENKQYAWAFWLFREEFALFIIKNKTDLSGANLSWADLRGANLRGTDLRDSYYEYQGIAYKFTNGVLIKL